MPETKDCLQEGRPACECLQATASAKECLGVCHQRVVIALCGEGAFEKELSAQPRSKPESEIAVAHGARAGARQTDACAEVSGIIKKVSLRV